MLNSGQKAALDALKVETERTFRYERHHDGIRDAYLTLNIEGVHAHIYGSCQTVDELEYAVARLIAAFRKEIGHGRAEKPTT